MKSKSMHEIEQENKWNTKIKIGLAIWRGGNKLIKGKKPWNSQNNNYPWAPFSHILVI